MDLTRDFKPNDVGRLVGIVEGGGIIVFLIPNWDQWDTFNTIFKETLTVPQFPEPRHVFLTWIKKKLLEHDGIGIYDVDNNKVTEEYDGTSWSNGGNLNTGRHSAGGCASGATALIAGGDDGSPIIAIRQRHTTEHHGPSKAICRWDL